MSDYVIEKCPFTVGFNKKACLGSWKKIGAAPCTIACLNDKKVRREIGDADDEINIAMHAIQECNDVAIALLDHHGYEGSHLKAEIKHIEQDSDSLTVPHSKEQHIALANAKTHGARFKVTHKEHLTFDDLFLAAIVPQREADIKAMEKRNKKSWRPNQMLKTLSRSLSWPRIFQHTVSLKLIS